MKVNDTNSNGEKKSEVEILIERIQQIQKEVKEINLFKKEEEDAFTEGAEDVMEIEETISPKLSNLNKKGLRTKKRN